jgi:hypothetical protein
MAKKSSPKPQPLLIEIRGYRLETARLEYSASGEATRRWTDNLLNSLLGLYFLKLATMIGEHQDKLADTLEPAEATA